MYPLYTIVNRLGRQVEVQEVSARTSAVQAITKRTKCPIIPDKGHVLCTAHVSKCNVLLCSIIYISLQWVLFKFSIAQETSLLDNCVFELILSSSDALRQTSKR